MAKQNISFIERHVEKFVLGLTAAVFLAVLFLYFVQTPHAVEVDGRPVGVDAFYSELRDTAEQTRNRILNARLDDPGSEPQGVNVGDIRASISPYASTGLPRELSVPIVPPGPPVPDVTGTITPDKIRLARVLAPTSLAVTSGRAFVGLPAPREIPLQTGQSLPEALPPITENHHWVAVFAAFHRKEQREQFEAARYSPDRQRILVARLEAERQTLLPSGQWSEPELVEGYAPEKVQIRATIPLYKQDDGTFAVLDTDQSYLNALAIYLSTAEAQEDILRPAFQALLDMPYAWSAPRILPGTNLSLEEYGVEFPPDEKDRRVRPTDGQPPSPTRRTDRTTGRTTRTGRTEGRTPRVSRRAMEETEGRTARPGVRPPAGAPGQPADAAARQEIARLIREARAAIEKKEFLDAEELLMEVMQHPAANPAQRQEAQNTLNSIRQDIDRARQAEAIRRRQTEALGADLPGEDVEPCWLTDITASPGRTYRYRMRVLLFNQYVGQAQRLEVPEDAGKVVIASEWSAWSDPVEVPPVRYLFVTKGVDNRTAQVEIRQWDKGQWAVGAGPRAIGQMLRFDGDNRQSLEFPGVLAGVEDRRNFQERRMGRDGTVSYRERPTVAVVLIHADGSVEERNAVDDNEAKNRLLAQIKKEAEWQSLFEQGPGRPSRESYEPPRPGPGGTGRPPAPPRGGGGPRPRPGGDIQP